MPIPTPDPLGLPAPVWLLQGLLILTFVLHVVPMTITLGGSALALVADLWGRSSDSDALQRLARQLGGMLPVVTAFTITLGVAPLLFVQLLYGLFFYPATILIGWSWLGVIGLLLAGYGGLYLSAWKGRVLGRWRPVVNALSTIMFLATAFVYTNAMTLMLAPQRWLPMYALSEGKGTSLHLAEASLWPRYVHILLGAVALAAALVVLLGHLSADETYGRRVRRYGLIWLVPAVLAQFAVGQWYLSHLDETARAALGGAGLQILVPVAAALGLVALGLSLLAERFARRPSLVISAATALVLAVAVLAVLRHMARQAMLSPYLPADAWRVQPQTVIFVVFVVTLLVTVSVIAAMVVRFFRAHAT